MIINQSIVMFNRSKTSINTNVLVRDIDFAPTRHYLGRSGYRFAVRLQDSTGTVIDINESYLKLRMEQISVVRKDVNSDTANLTVTNIGTKDCYQVYVDLFGREFANRLTANKTLCPLDENQYFISGSNVSADYGFIRISLTKCTGPG